MEYAVKASKTDLLYGLKSTRLAIFLAFASVFAGVSVSSARETPQESRPVAAEHPRAAEAIEVFYNERGLQPFWLTPSDGLRNADYLLGALGDAASHGLSPARYRFDQLSSQVALLTPESSLDEVARLERALSSAFLLYLDDLRAGAADPEALDLKVHVDPARPDPLRMLREMAQINDVPQVLEQIVPTDPRYRRLRDALNTMTAQAKAGGWGPTVPGRGLKKGETSVAADALRRRLIAMGDLPPEPELMSTASSTVSTYDERLQGAVAQFQDRHGLVADGIAGPATLRALNQPIGRRIAQTMLNLERLRWRANQKLGRRIEVNQAAFRMTVFDDTDTPLHESRVVIGKSERRLQTPEFSRSMSYLVLNPRWNVPRSIVSREFLPAAKADPTFFERQNMDLYRRGKIIDATKDVNWEQMTPEIFGEHFGVIQKPGPGNALGNVKFMFPNGHNIYLHDTPSKHLFSQEMRAHSHGCVRVERPFALAWLLLSEQSADPGTMIENILATGDETEVPLERPIPIHLMYMTSWVDHTGTLHFREDVYGRDEALARALHADVEERQTSGL
jgi:murein L,D-transpeptidase YcbB/YkuD